MAEIPNLEKLEAFLGSLTRFDPNDINFNHSIVENKVSVKYSDGASSTVDEQKIWFKEIEGFSIKSTRSIISKALTHIKHPINDKIIDSILLLYTYMKPKQENNISKLNYILSASEVVSLSQYFITSVQANKDYFGLKFGSFTIENFDIQKFEYRCKKATSNYFELHGKKLRDRISIEREHFDTCIINWQSISNSLNVQSRTFNDHLLIYFENLANYHFDLFWDVFAEEQNLQISFGIGYIDSKIFRSLPYSDMISIFLNIEAFNRKIGYVVPTLMYPNISINNSLNLSIKTVLNHLLQKYSFSNFNESEIHKTIITYIKFNAKAHRSLNENQYDEGFLNFIISLDLLFGTKGESVQSVSNRVAILTYLSFNSNFQAQKKFIGKIYEARSKYVHEGLQIDIELLESTEIICRIILEVLFKIQKSPDIRHKDYFNKWLKKLDYIVSSIEAEESVPQDVLLNSGIEYYNTSSFSV